MPSISEHFLNYKAWQKITVKKYVTALRVDENSEFFSLLHTSLIDCLSVSVPWTLIITY